MSPWYPAFLNIKGKHCVVFGGGVVAEGKIAKLRDAGAKITVVSPRVTAGILAVGQQGHLDWQAREYQTGDLQGAFLGIATTNVRSVNQSIFQEAEELGVLLNVVDEPAKCSFIAPSIVSRGPVTVAISTGGASPALARKFREELTASPVLGWADLAGIMSQARRQVKNQALAVDPQRWQCCLTPELLQLAQEGREEEALISLMSNLAGDNAPHLCPEVDRCQPGGCRRSPDEE
jgi:precorrin-2 dehydrogenase/sirohydrochlorin ferrochelatase